MAVGAEKLFKWLFSLDIATGGLLRLIAATCTSQAWWLNYCIKWECVCCLSMTFISVADDNPSILFQNVYYFSCCIIPWMVWNNSEQLIPLLSNSCDLQCVSISPQTQNTPDTSSKWAPLPLNNKRVHRIALIYFFCLIKIQPLPSP